MTDDSESRDIIKLTYFGPPATVGYLAQLLKEQGISVEYDPPIEYKDDFIREVAVVLTAEGALAVLSAGVKGAVSELQRRFPGTRVEGVPNDPETSGADPAKTAPADDSAPGRHRRQD